jgi:hypothetical protein
MKRTSMSVTLTIVTAAFALAGCGTSAEDTATTAPSPVASSPAAVPSSSVAPSPSPSPLADQVIRITYAGGKVSGVGAVVKVKKNNTVALVVTSDVADEVHLHGYDKSADVDKGGTVTLLFKASLPGKWEVELEKLKRRLVFLEVQ